MLNNKKVPWIPPIFHDSKFATDFTKKSISLILFLQNSAQLLKKAVFSPHQLFSLPISTWQKLNSPGMILKESSANSILIKLMVMI